MGGFDWNCSKCTFLHKYPAQRCQMCGALRVSREEMRDFVQGKRIADKNHGTAGGDFNPSRGSAAVNNTNNVNDSSSSAAPDRGDNSVEQSSCLHSSGPQHQNQSARPVNPYANRPTASYRPNSSIGSNNNPYASRPASSYSRPTSSGGVINPYARPNSSGGAKNNCARTVDEQSAGQQNANMQQNLGPNQQTQPIPNPYAASSSRQNAERASPYVSTHQQVMNITNVQNQPTRESSGYNQGQNFPTDNRQSLYELNDQNQYYRAQNGMNRNHFNQRTLQGGFNEQDTLHEGMNQPSHDPIAANQSHLDRLDQNRQNASSQVIRDKPYAPLFLVNQGNITTSRSNGQGTATPKSNSNLQASSTSRWNRGLPYEEGPVPLSESTSHNWIFPIDDKYPERSYQLQMSHTSIMANTLVSLPTGLGKTLIASVVMYNYYRWFPTGKVVFCAPTRPLVTQQIQACYNIMGIPERHTAEITAKSKPEARQKIWAAKRVFFCTPQALVKDIEGDRCNAKDIVCVVIDEAHKATGNHASAQLVSLIKNAGAKFRLLGLSATPGTDIKSIQKVITTLNISEIEAKTENDHDVMQYIHKRQEDVIIVEQPDAISRIDAKFSDLMAHSIERLHSNNVGRGIIHNHHSLKTYSLMKVKEKFKERNPNDHSLDGTFQMLFEMAGIRNQLYSHGVLTVRNRLQTLQRYPKPGMGAVVKGEKFQALLREVSKATHATQDSQDDDQEATKDLLKNNPKYKELHKLLVEHFAKKKADNQDTRVIIFSQWRDSVDSIVSMINSQNDETLKPSAFIGQNKKSGGSKKSSSREVDSRLGTELVGMNQAQQQRVLEDFKVGIYNILVCTSVAEEGLDISNVDLIVNFDVLKSPIRSIQRSGRTGRKRDGRVVFLISKGTEESNYNESVVNKKKIERALKSNKSTFQLCDASPMFPTEPALHRQKMVKADFRMSQVGGHTPKGSRKSRSAPRQKPVCTDWVLTAAQERERQNFGDLPDLYSSDVHMENNRCFPQPLRHKYLKYRERSNTTQRYRRGRGSYRDTSTTVSCLVEFERKHLSTSKILALSPLDEALTKLLSAQKCTAECMVLEDDDRSVDASEPSMVSVHCPSINGEDLTEILSVEATDDSDSLDNIFGGSETCVPDGISASQISFLFDSEEHKTCSVSPPPGFKTFVSTDDNSDGSESVSGQSYSPQPFGNTVDVDLKFDFFDNARHPTAEKRDSCNERIESFEHSAADHEPNYVIRNEGTVELDPGVAQIFEECNVESDVNLDANDKKFSQEKKRNASQTTTNATDNRGLTSFLDNERSIYGLSPGQGPCSGDCERDFIVALQLPTPPDTSDDESMNDNASQVCTGERDVILDTSKVEGIEIDRQPQIEDPHAEYHIEPLQLPTQLSSSSDDESDEDEVLSLECRDESVGGEREVEQNGKFDISNAEAGDSCQILDNEVKENIREPREQSSSSLENEAIDSPTDEPFEIDQVQNAFDQIVPLFLPTQYASSSDEEESEDEQHNAGIPIDATAATVLIDLCDENDDDSSAKKMPPPTSLKNITNMADQHFSPCDDLIDTPVPTNVKLDASTSRMFPDDLTDTPINKQLKLVARPRLSEGLSDTPIKTAEKSKAPKRLARARKRLRAAANDKENQMVAVAAAVADRQERVKQRIEEKYRCRFLDTEAALDGSGEDSDEEDAIKQIEEDESNSSFINDSSQLGYTQDDLDNLDVDRKVREDSIDPADSLLHRQLNHERNLAEQFKTPVFNRRMMRDSLSQNAPMSQQGLGNMNFIKSVLEHHRQGGDSNELENEYHLLVGDTSLDDSQINSPLSIADSPEMQCSQPIAKSSHDSNRKSHIAPTVTSVQQHPINQPTSLTAEQKAMIEAKRAAALKRRQERMQKQQQQQQQQTSVSNPYAK